MAGRPNSFMPLYIGDYLSDTGHLSGMAHGAYLLLLMQYWKTGKPLPIEDEKLCRIARLSRAEWDAVSADVRGFFTVTVMDTVTVLTHKRVEQEMEHARGVYQSRKAASDRANAAKKAAQERMAARNGNLDGNRSGDRDGDRHASQSQSQSHEEGSSLREDIDVLPGWLPIPAWKGFLEMRKRIRAPMTDRAKTLAIRQLDELRQRGHDPTVILDQSTQNSWKGLFEPKVTGNGNRNAKPSPHRDFCAAGIEVAREFLDGPSDDSSFADETRRPLLPS